MSSIIPMHDIDLQLVTSLGTSSHVAENTADFRDRAGHGCFLCLESHRHGQYAVLVPCLRPTRARRVKGHSDCFSDNPKPIYEKMIPWDSACESDSDIYQRLTDTCYQHLGSWKRWLPYYGITEVLEVNFYFAGVVESKGRYPIQMESVQLDKVLEECEEIIARYPADPYFDMDDVCLDDDTHSKKCLIGMHEWSQPCIRVDAEKAARRRNRLLFLSLLKVSARDSASANGLHTLEGLAQESCIYDIKYSSRLLFPSFFPSLQKRSYSDLIRGENKVVLPLPYELFRGTDQMRGLRFVLGWQTDRMIEIPYRVSCVWFGIAAIWLGLVFWRVGGGDWGIGLAFAQVVAASIAIVIASVQQ
ncbi:unnamed protein product [Clonostachys solani]|uniref:Uncharacterized protein n=1 Tax=Clonostachys solani TaxID=160281 RepID=A0A9P0ELK8_9HYPO|nr:unnamed protein product [Clonostachys solani]